MLKTLVKKAKKSKGGFTLIELIVVVAILAILAAILIPTISGQISKANDSKGNSMANSAYLACQLAITAEENNTTPITVNSANIARDALHYYNGSIYSVDYSTSSNALNSVTIFSNGRYYTYPASAATSSSNPQSSSPTSATSATSSTGTTF